MSPQVHLYGSYNPGRVEETQHHELEQRDL